MYYLIHNHRDNTDATAPDRESIPDTIIALFSATVDDGAQLGRIENAAYVLADMLEVGFDTSSIVQYLGIRITELDTPPEPVPTP